MAAGQGLSERQAERVFLEHVGLSPKLFGRLTRMNEALKLRASDEALSWADIAASAGYFDQSHMVRDFRDLNGATPAQFAELGLRARRYRFAADGDVGFVLCGKPAAHAG